GVVKSPDAFERTQRMVERTVFLHEDDNVFGIQVGAARRRADGQCTLDGRRDGSRHTRSTGQYSQFFKKFSSVFSHGSDCVKVSGITKFYEVPNPRNASAARAAPNRGPTTGTHA